MIQTNFPAVEYLARVGLTSEVVRVEVNGCWCFKEQWYYKGEPTDYKRQESTKDWAERNGLELNGDLT